MMNEIEIIAEIGVNHGGSVDVAHDLIDSAKSAGCDTVKFQLFHGNRYPELQLTASQLSDLRQYALAIDLKFLCTPDDWEDARELKLIGCDRIKIGSSNITNLPLLQYIAKLEMKVILSTGACTAAEVDKALEVIRRETSRKCVLMHCVSAYPSPPTELNLSCMARLAEQAAAVGYSDHTIGDNYQSALVMLGMGATVFEKHFTGSHYWKGPDHQMSADIFEMKRYVTELRAHMLALGDGVKRVMPCEFENRDEYELFVEAQNAHSPKV